MTTVETGKAAYVFDLRAQVKKKAEEKQMHENGSLRGFYLDVDGYTVAPEIFDCAEVTDASGKKMRVRLETGIDTPYEVVVCESGDSEEIYYIRPGREQECTEVTHDAEGKKLLVLHRENMQMTVETTRLTSQNNCSINGNVNPELRKLSLNASEMLYVNNRDKRHSLWSFLGLAPRVPEELLVAWADKAADKAQAELPAGRGPNVT